MGTRYLFYLITSILSLSSIMAQAKVLSPIDRQLIATCMVLEAGCDGREGMQAVLNVILNRAEGQQTRMVPEIIKRGTFSCMAEIWTIPSPNYGALFTRALNQNSAYATALQLINTLEDGVLLDNTAGSTHFHATYVNPYWVSKMNYIITIGGHHFYIEPTRG